MNMMVVKGFGRFVAVAAVAAMVLAGCDGGGEKTMTDEEKWTGPLVEIGSDTMIGSAGPLGLDPSAVMFVADGEKYDCGMFATDFGWRHALALRAVKKGMTPPSEMMASLTGRITRAILSTQLANMLVTK